MGSLELTVRRFLPLLLFAILALGLPGCGASDRIEEEIDRTRVEAERRLKEIRRDLEGRADRLRKRIEELIGELEQAVPEARRTAPEVRSRGNTEPSTIDEFMTGVLGSIDSYWEQTFAASDLPQPRVTFVSIPPGESATTACNTVADDQAAFYCPADDTIYVAQVFASALYEGVLRGLPGESSGARAEGDFAVAYVLAHEYAHNLQHELEIFDTRIESPSVKPFELQADCMAGTWANSVFEQGLIDESDIEEATNAALAVGDFDVGNAQHHGTPEERRDALLVGFRGGDPASCSRFVPAA